MHALNKYHFKGQLPGEIILKVIRRHWFDIFWQYIPLSALLALLILSMMILPSLVPDLYTSPQLFYFAHSLFLLALWLYAALIWVDYYLDVWIVTNKRVVNVEQKGLFMRDVSELRYNKIQDITTEVKGVIPTFLNYGNVYIQTAGEQLRFLFHNVPDPYSIKGQLVELQKRQRTQDLGEMEALLHPGEHIET